MRHSALVFFVTVTFVVFAAEARYKRKFDSDFVFAEEDLKSYLENNSDGRVILLAYKYTNRLTPQHRNMLVHLAICQQRDIAFANSPTPGKLDDFKIKSENFLTIASEIEALFPNEDASVYYIPYKKVGNEQILASGKLFDHFNYIKKCLKDDLILSKKAAKGSEASEVIENSSLTNNELIQQEEWLKSNISPKETVFEYWEKTFHFRRKILLNDNLPVNDYLNRYRALSFEFGCDLVKIDFEKLHPGKSNNFLSEWPILRKKLLHLLQGSRLPKQEEHRTLLMNILLLEEKKQDGIILYLLPTLFKPTQIAYKKVKRARISTENCKKKPSSLEIQEAFVLHVESDTKDESKSVTGKKKWIHDPDSDLCVPLKCKKKELCLLENLYTAVCVSKKELHKNGDIIMSKSRYLAEEAKKKAVFKEDDLDDDDDDDDDDDLDDDEDDDDDIFYDNSPSSNVENNLNDVGSQKCTPCPIMKPVFLCGSDNRTYSSICRLDYHNCVHRTSVKATCKGFCPCKEAKDQSSNANKNKYVAEKQKKDPQVDRVSDVYALTPEDFKYENKLYKYIRYSKNADAENLKKKYYNRMKTSTPDYQEKDGYRGENDVSDDKPAPVKPNKKKECSEAALKSMGNRLLDWFSVIKAENRRRPEYKGKDIVSFGCKPEVIWMFKHLDLDGDGQLTLQELYDLEHDQNEHCIKPFLDMCDTNRDIFVSPYEWCYCFMKSERPCAAVRKRIPQHIMTGVYVPTCDAEGYYEPMQCHSATGMCWCVNKHGVEFANSKTHGKVDCDLYFIKAGATEKTTSPEVNSKSNNDVENSMNKKIDSNNSDDDDDDSDDDDDFDGSGDQPLEF